MKIRIVKKPYAEVAALPRPKHKKPMKMPVFFRVLLKLLCLPAMLLTGAEEMQNLVDELFRTPLPARTPDGRTIIHIVSDNEIERFFAK